MSAGRLALGWARLYTRGLPEDVRAGRLAEMESDVWEQRAAYGEGLRTELGVVSRSIRGVAADLSWRRSQRRGRMLLSRASIVRGGAWSLALLSYLVLVAAHAYASTALLGLGLYGADWPRGELMAHARTSAALLALLVAGTLVVTRHTRSGASLLAAGALLTPVAYPWGAAVYGPTGVAVAAAVVVLARRRQRASSAAS